MNEDKRNNIIYINKSGELLIWLIIILFLAIILFFIRIQNSNNKKVFDIFMPDVDGLIVGSPVRAMGIEVGHVIKIRPVKDEVYVRFIITDDSVVLPQGTIATVEFNGMAGSKSLELYLPEKGDYIDSSVQLLSVTPPKRLSDAAGLLNEMFKKIGNIIAVSSRFGAKVSEIEFPDSGGNINDMRHFLKYADDIINVQQERVDNLRRKIDAKSKK